MYFSETERIVADIEAKSKGQMSVEEILLTEILDWQINPKRQQMLVRQLMAKYGIDSGCVLRHYDVTGKKCPEPFVRDAAQWLAFRRLIVEDDEMEKQILIKLNGKKKTVRAIEKGGHNFVMLQDLRDEKIVISYDGVPVVQVR